MNKLSIIIPVYFSEATLWDCYNDLKENALKKINNYELIFVDDGSEDLSWEICKEIAANDKSVRLIKLSRNFGSHAACYAALSICTGDCAAIKAADCQEPSSLLLSMYESWKQGNKVVIAARKDRNESLLKRTFANVYYGLVRKFVSKKMPKTGFDCYLIDRKVIEALKLLDERNSAITLQILWTGFKTSTVFYTRLERQKGKSQWTLSKKLKLTIDTLVSFSPFPVRLAQLFGFLFSAGSVIWGVLLIIFRLSGIIEVEGWTALMIVSLFSSGIILLSLGILGEYIWRTLDVAQNRPVYFIEEEINNENCTENGNE